MKPRTRLAWLSSAAANSGHSYDMGDLLPNCSLLIAEKLVQSLKVDEGPSGKVIDGRRREKFPLRAAETWNGSLNTSLEHFAWTKPGLQWSGTQ